MTNKLNKKEIINLLPHREPMLLIEELINVKDKHSLPFYAGETVCICMSICICMLYMYVCIC